jgi:hypothetical protein
VRIAAALDQGDGKAIAKAEAVAPLSPQQRASIWHLRQHVAARAALCEQRVSREFSDWKKLVKSARPARVEAELPEDLDYWPLDDTEWAVSRRAVSPPEPGDGDQDDLETGEPCECECPECEEGNCRECSDPDCDDLNYLQGDERDTDEETRSFYGYIEDED